MLGLLAVQFTHTITLGSIILGVLVTIAGLATFGYGVRWKAAAEAWKAAAESLEEGRKAYQLRSQRLEDEMGELRKEYAECKQVIGEQKAMIIALEAQPKFGDIVAAIHSAVETSRVYSDKNFERLYSEHEKTRAALRELQQREGGEHIT